MLYLLMVELMIYEMIYEMIFETDYGSERFLKHRSEIKKFIESEPKAEGF